MTAACVWTLSASCPAWPSSSASSVSALPGADGAKGGGLRSCGTREVGPHLTPLCTGYCSQHLDGGEGVVCLTHRQVSLECRVRVGECREPPSLISAVSSRPVDAGGHLLLDLSPWSPASPHPSLDRGEGTAALTVGKRGLGRQPAWSGFQAPPLTGWVTLGKSLHLCFVLGQGHGACPVRAA